MFGGSDPQQLGLLGAAAQILNASGPSLMPHSLGQILGSAYGAYNDATNSAQDRQQRTQQAQQLSELRGLQIQGEQGTLADQQRARAQADALRQFYINRANPGQADATQTPTVPTMASAMPGIGPNSPKIGGPDWLQAYQASQQSGAPAANVAPQAAAGPYEQRMGLARDLRNAGFNAEADAQEAAALKFKPKYSTDFRPGMGADGQLHNYVLADDGTLKDTGIGAKPEMTEVDLGGTKQFVDKNRVTNGQTFAKTMTFADRNSADRLTFDRQQATDNQDEVMDPLAVRMTAQQYLAGDTSALQNFGRGAQGARNLNAVRLEISKQANAAGLNGADIAAKVAEFAGTKAGQRTAATRSAGIEIAANEAAQLVPLALDASRKVARSGFLPFGKAQIMFDTNVNDPNLRQFTMANTALVNAYGQAMARGGSATVSDKDHARELLSTAMDQPSYEAAVGQLQKEIRAAQAAPKDVRRAISADVSGRGSGSDGGPAPATQTGAKVATLSDIAATAKASGKSTKQVTADLRAAGYTITGGQ
jgi:hypothetical protein